MKQQNILLITAAIAIVVAVFAIRGCYQQKARISDLKANINNVDSQQIKHWTDKAGTEHAMVQVLQGEIGVLQVVHQKEFDSLSLLLKIKPKQILDVQKVRDTLRDTVQIPVQASTIFVRSGCDSIPQIFTYRSNGVLITGEVLHNKANIDYEAEDTLTSTTYLKKSGFLGLRKQLYTDYFNSNPKFKIKTIQHIQTRTPVKRFGVGVQAGITISSGLKPQPYVGAGLTYNLWMF